MDWRSIEVLETLKVDVYTKTISLLVNIKSEKHPEGVPTVLIGYKQAFADATTIVQLLQGTFFSSSVTSTTNQDTPSILLLENNDIYYQYLVFLGEYSAAKISLIHPATPVHIAKYRHQERLLIEETPALYATSTLPYIDQLSQARIKWVDNILTGSSEQDKILYDNPDPQDGFVILPDSKWDQKTLNALYLLVLVRRGDLRSLRDVRGHLHASLLQDIRQRAKEVVSTKYPSIKPNQLRMYVHYLPTYYYFHLHIVHLELESMGCAVGAAHLLDDIIDNVTHIKDDYYAQRTLYYTLGVEHELYARHLAWAAEQIKE